MAKSERESMIIRITVAVVCLLFSLIWAVYRGQAFLDVVDHMVASFGGLVPGAVLAWIIWEVTQTSRVPEQFGVVATKNIEKLGYYKSNFLIRLTFDRDILSFDLSSLVIPVLNKGTTCRALGMGNDQPAWRKDINHEYWKLGNQDAIYDPRTQNQDRPTLKIYQATIENYGYICKVDDSHNVIKDKHILKYAVDSIRLEASLPLNWNLRIIRSGLDEVITTVAHQGNTRKQCVCCIQEIIPQGAEIEWVISRQN